MHYTILLNQLSIISQWKNHTGQPIQGHFSVAVRDALKSDFQRFDQTIYTDLLLTSDLKGYIHQPGYYFANNSPRRRVALDNLLMIHGWRKYDISQAISATPEIPIYLPETRLTLHGQVTSFLRNKEQKDISVSVIARRDTISAAGTTVTDSLGVLPHSNGCLQWFHECGYSNSP